LRAVRQLARFVKGALKLKDLIWLPKRDTDPNSRMENSAGAIFSMVLTKAGFSEMRSFPMDLSPGRRKGKSLSNGFPSETKGI
jgi:hypothetical protein